MEEAIAIVKKYRDNVLGMSMCEQIQRAVLNSIIEDLEAAQQGMHSTLLPVRRKLVSCPNCKLVFGVDSPVSQSE